MENDRNGIQLTGKLKGTGRVQKHILRSVKMTSSGINMEWWIQLLRRTAIVVGATRGPVFCDDDGYVWDSDLGCSCLGD